MMCLDITSHKDSVFFVSDLSDGIIPKSQPFLVKACSLLTQATCTHACMYQLMYTHAHFNNHCCYCHHYSIQLYTVHEAPAYTLCGKTCIFWTHYCQELILRERRVSNAV